MKKANIRRIKISKNNRIKDDIMALDIRIAVIAGTGVYEPEIMTNARMKQ